DGGMVADDGAFVLEVVMEPEALGGQVFADYRHPEVGAVASAVLPGQGVAVMARAVGAPAHLGQQFLPFLAREAAIFEVGPGPFAAMVKEADVVVFAFERPDLALDEIV